jgi:hypothetical protein
MEGKGEVVWEEEVEWVLYNGVYTLGNVGRIEATPGGRGLRDCLFLHEAH